MAMRSFSIVPSILGPDNGDGCIEFYVYIQFLTGKVFLEKKT